MGVGQMATDPRGETPGRARGMGGERAGRGRDRRGAHAVIGEGLTLIELKDQRHRAETRLGEAERALARLEAE